MRVVGEWGEALGGDATSSGIMSMYRESVEWGADFDCVLRSFEDWEAAADRLIAAARAGARTFYAGYSMSASKSSRVAARMYDAGCALNFLGAMDATVYDPPVPLQKNVHEAVCLWNLDYLDNLFVAEVGHARLTLAPGNNVTRLLTRKIFCFHGSVDKIRSNQLAILNGIKPLAT